MVTIGDGQAGRLRKSLIRRDSPDGTGLAISPWWRHACRPSGGSFICPTEKASSSLSARCWPWAPLPSQAQDVVPQDGRPTGGDDRYDRYGDDRMYKDGIYADDDFWYGDQQPRDQHAVPRHGPQQRRHDQPLRVARQRHVLPQPGLEQRRRALRPRGARATRSASATRTRASRRSTVTATAAIDRGEWLGSRSDVPPPRPQQRRLHHHARSASPLSLSGDRVGVQGGWPERPAPFFLGVTRLSVAKDSRSRAPPVSR